jgi:hypothetical protein
MLIENPDRNKALHVTLQRNSRAHRIALQQEFTDKDIPYYSEHVYMSKTLSSIGETIVLDIPQVGQRAVPFIANLKNKNLPIFEELLMNYELERARIRNDYIVNHSSDYKSFLKHLADQHPDSNIRPEVLFKLSISICKSGISFISIFLYDLYSLLSQLLNQFLTLV